MNSQIVKATVLVLFFSATAYASPRHQQQQQEREQGEIYTINVDWNDKRSLQDGIVQMCDDSYYRAVEIVIPGKPYENFTIEMDADITSGKSSLGCSVLKTEGAGSTTYTFDADNGGCAIRVHKVRKDLREKPQSADYEVHDAC